MDSTRKSRIRGNTLSRFGVLALALALSAGAPSAVAQTLPDPNLTVFGVPVATQFDDAYSYSTRILDYLLPGDGWSDAAGTGQLDLIVTTRSAGQTNSDLGFNIPDPTTNTNTNPINDSWGTAATTGDMLVADLYNYLFTTFGANTPVFTFDQNETGGNPDLLVSAKVEIIDPVTGVLKAWYFDNLLNTAYDPDSPVTAPGSITIPDVMNDPADFITFNNNTGSGKFDFIVFVPDMDLSAWADLDNLFRLSWIFSGVDDGGEEITITGRFTGDVCPDPTLPQCQVIPEPQSLALMGMGLLAVALVGRRRRFPLIGR